METPFALGGRRRTPDERDYKLAAFSAVPITRPDTFSSPVPQIFMQSKFGTCGAHAGAQVASIISGVPKSPKYLWKIIKTLDGYGLNDGTDMRSIFKALQQGIVDYSVMPNPTEVGEYPAGYMIEQYSDINEITPNIKVKATFKIPNYTIEDTPSMSDIKDAIFQHKAVILLVDCGDGWWIPDWAHANPLHLGNFVGHHFITASQYGLTVIDGANSWSVQWGNRGMFEFLENYLPHVIEMGTPIMDGKYIFQKDMYYNDTSADVHALQIALGLPAVDQTGYFGPITRTAVLAYQDAHHIPISFLQRYISYCCKVGPQTRAVLNS